jgi:acetyltransferase-like isoleucine patch superfamily enzyme
VRKGVRIGQQCIIGKGAYIDFDVQLGSRVKIQNYALVYHGAIVEDGVFIGPRACLTNDKLPRAITPSGALKGTDDWEVGRIVVRYGASIGAGAIVLPGVTIGRFAMVGAGAVVTRDVPDHGLVVGQPARHVGYVCRCGRRFRCGRRLAPVEAGTFWCAVCEERYSLPEAIGEPARRESQAQELD